MPLWSRAAAGNADWSSIYAGYNSATDWPTVSFVSELVAAFPDAKYILILRNPESWVDSYLETNEVFNAGPMAFPPELGDWLAMLCPVLARMGFSPGLVGKALIAAFNAHSVHQ